MRAARASLLLVVTALACGGAPPPPPKASPAPPVAPARPEPRSEADLSPIAKPDNVIAIARLPRPGKVFRQLATWGSRGNFSDVIGELAVELGDVIAHDASLDALVAIERRPVGPVPTVSTAFSVGLVSLERALSGLQSREVATGVHVLEAGSRRCAVAAAAGAVPARLVCASTRSALDELLPYATRGLTREPPAAHDFSMQIDVARIQALHGDRFAGLQRWALPFAGAALSQIDDRLDRALTPLLESIYGELLAIVGDVDKVELSATFSDSHVDGLATASLGRDARSVLAKTLLELGPRQAAPPPDFWKLPADAELAFFSHGMLPQRAAVLRRTLTGTLSRGIRTAVPGKTLELVTEALFPEPPFVYAGGVLEETLDREPTLGGYIRRRTERMLGWHVIGVEAEPVALGKRLDRGMNDYNAGPLRNLVYGEAERLCKGMPKITRRAAPPKGLPRGSVLYEMVIPGKVFDDCAAGSGYGHFTPRTAQLRRATRPLSVAVVYAPGTPRSWIVVSPNTEYALGKLRDIFTARPETRLESLRAGLQPLETKAAFGFAASDALLGARSPRGRATLTISADGARTIRVAARIPGTMLGR